MSRGTARSMSSSGRPSRGAITALELLAADDRVRRGGRGDDDVGALELGGQLVEAHAVAAEALRERAARSRRRLATKIVRTPWSASARAVSSLVSPAPRISTCAVREIAERARARARRRPTTRDTRLAAIAVSRRTRLPVGSAARNRRLVSGPVVPCVERELVGALDLALDLGLADDHRLEPGGDAEEVARRVAVAQRVDRVDELGRPDPGLAGEHPERRRSRPRPGRRRRGRARCGCRSRSRPPRGPPRRR